MVDRNQAARERAHAQRMFNQDLQRFVRLLNEGKTGLLDRFNVQVQPGDLVLYQPDWQQVYDVIDIAPEMDPQHPVGTLTMKLRCTIDVKFIAGHRSMTIIKCGRRPEADETQKTPAPLLASPGSQPPAAETGGDTEAAASEASAAPPSHVTTPEDAPDYVGDRGSEEPQS